MPTIVVVGGFAESLINFRGPLLNDLVRRGHRVIGCAPQASDKIVARLQQLGVEYCHIPIDRTGINPLKDFFTFFALFSLFIKVKPDVFIGYTIKPVIFGSLAARFAGIRKRYAMITGLGWAFTAEKDTFSPLRSLVRLLYRLSLAGNRKVFFQNPDDRDFFLNNFLVQSIEKTVIINGSGIDIDFFSPVPIPGDVTFLLIARFLKDKGIIEYVEAAREVKKEHPDVVFYLVGWSDSNPASISAEEIELWEREGTIINLGRLDDVRKSIGLCSVYVLPSYREGTPRTVLEAMSMGRPVITTDAPGCRETVEDCVNGLLVPVQDSEAVKNAMLKFIQQPHLIGRMGEKSRERAISRYDVRKVNRVILETIGC